MTPQKKAEYILHIVSESLYESNGTSSGASNIAMILADEVQANTSNWKYWQEVKNHLIKM